MEFWLLNTKQWNQKIELHGNVCFFTDSTYLGCYQGPDVLNWQTTFALIADADISTESNCVDHCRIKQFLYAAMQVLDRNMCIMWVGSFTIFKFLSARQVKLQHWTSEWSKCTWLYSSAVQPAGRMRPADWFKSFLKYFQIVFKNQVTENLA